MKYVTFKANEFFDWLETPDVREPVHLDDAVVIRHQDLFAAPALYTYSNSILSLVELLETIDPAGVSVTQQKRSELRALADYFHEQGVLAAQHPRKKLPD